MEEVSGASCGNAEITIKPLSDNAFVAFFQRIGRWWLGVWYGFADKHQKAAPLIYKIFFFIAFSLGVTVWQYIIMTFLPYAFQSLNNGPWGFPNAPLKAAGGVPYILFGDASGLGYFIAFEIAVFTAQCINFPLQRNITYKSHGNPWFQAMWYFIGWVLVSVFTNAIWGLCNCFLTYWGVPEAVNGFIKTVITGGVSMVIFFFIFLIIFPDRQKQAKGARRRYEKLKASGADEQKLDLARQKCETLERQARIEKARRESITAESSANSKAVAWDAAVKKLEKLKESNAPEAEQNAQSELVEKRYGEALESAEKRDKARAEYDKVLSADGAEPEAQSDIECEEPVENTEAEQTDSQGEEKAEE